MDAKGEPKGKRRLSEPLVAVKAKEPRKVSDCSDSVVGSSSSPLLSESGGDDDCIGSDAAECSVPPYYLRNFAIVAEHSRDVLSSLFSDDEIATIDAFFGIPERLQRLFVRLFLRKGPWFSIAALSYSEIADCVAGMASVARELSNFGFCSIAEEVTALNASELLPLAKVADLQRVCAAVGIKPSQCPSPARKSVVLERLNSAIGQKERRFPMQRTLDGKNLLFDAVGKAVGVPAVKLNDECSAVFRRAFRLFTMDWGNGDGTRGDETLMILTDIGVLTFPKYEVDRTAMPFRTRDAMLRFEAAVELESRFESSLGHRQQQQLSDSFDSAVAIAVSAHSKLVGVPRDEPPLSSEIIASLVDLSDECTVVCPFRPTGRWDASLSPNGPLDGVPVPLRRFTEGWVLSRVVRHFIGLLEKKRQYADAIQCAWLLLSLPFSPAHRGDLWLRMSVDMEHTGRKELSLLIAEEGLRDPLIGECTGDCKALQRRVLKLSKPPLRLKSPTFVSATLRTPSTLTIKAKRVGSSAPGEKSRFKDETTGAVCTVEELSLLSYGRKGWNGLHCESGVFQELFALLLWDAVFSQVKGAFLTPYQTAPLDVATESFFDSRRDILEGIFRELSSPTTDIAAKVRESWAAHEGVACRGIDWQSRRASLGTLESIAVAIGGKRLASVLRLIAVDGSSWGAGMPDLVLFREESSESPERALLVEVKGPGDSLSSVQEAWVDQLLACGLPVEICHVTKE